MTPRKLSLRERLEVLRMKLRGLGEKETEVELRRRASRRSGKGVATLHGKGAKTRRLQGACACVRDRLAKGGISPVAFESATRFGHSQRMRGTK